MSPLVSLEANGKGERGGGGELTQAGKLAPTLFPAMCARVSSPGANACTGSGPTAAVTQQQGIVCCLKRSGAVMCGPSPADYALLGGYAYAATARPPGGQVESRGAEAQAWRRHWQQHQQPLTRVFNKCSAPFSKAGTFCERNCKCRQPLAPALMVWEMRLLCTCTRCSS